MANLGNVGYCNTTFTAWACPIPWYLNSGLPKTPDQGRKIQGTITESGNSVENVKVLLYWRSTGMLIDTKYTNKAGYYEFNGLITGSNNYVVVAQDPSGGTVYNDVIRSLLTPG